MPKLFLLYFLTYKKYCGSLFAEIFALFSYIDYTIEKIRKIGEIPMKQTLIIGSAGVDVIINVPRLPKTGEDVHITRQTRSNGR